VYQVLYGETPSNPLNTVLDLEEFGKLGREGQGHGPLITIVDVTYCSPCVVKPIQYGIDIVIHSAYVYCSETLRLGIRVLAC
jgi:cystathionine beta-lyase/cystathionine gamma-synthase